MTEAVAVIDAYRFPRKERPGCQHQLGCRCEPPYWLRPSTPVEMEREQRMYPVGALAHEGIAP